MKFAKIFNIIFLTVLVSGIGYGVVTRVANTYINTDEINASKINQVLYVQSGNASDIKNVVDNLCLSNKCSVHLPGGVYTVTATDFFNPKSNMTFQGDGRENTIINVIEQNSSYSGYFDTSGYGQGSDADSVTIKDLTIDLNGVGEGGIVFRWSHSSTVDNVDIRNPSIGIYISTSNANQNKFNNVRIINASAQGLYLDTAERNQFENIHIITTLNNDGILMRQSEFNQFNNIYIQDTGTNLTSSYGNGIRMIEQCWENSFNNIHIINAREMAMDLNFGTNNVSSIGNKFNNLDIRCHSDSTGGIFIDEAQYMTISESSIYNCRNSINLNGAQNNHITGNYANKRVREETIQN